MIRAHDVPVLQHMAVLHPELTDRQRDVALLVSRYHEASQELPSSGWISRRLNMSRQRAHQHLEALRAKGWLDRLS